MKRHPRRSRHPSWLTALLFIVAICAAPALALAAESGSLPNAVTSMSAADIEGTAPPDDASRIERWNALKEAIFGKREVMEGSAVVQLDAPPRALDAALVPLTLNIVGGKQVKAAYVVIDNNPSPLAAHITFGPKADPSTLKLRVRVNEYTLIHAVAEAQDGKLYGVSKFVKAAGGCSAPAGPDESEALRDLGQMKVRLLGPFTPGKPLQAQLMVRHPNFNGMQMNQITRMYTPARFIKTTEVSYEGANVFRLESDISMSTDPVVTFGFVPRNAGKLHVRVVDSEDKTFEGSFDVPASGGPSASGPAAADAGAVPEPADFWTGPVNSATPRTLTGATVIRAPDLAALLKTDRAVLVDVSNSPPRPDKLAPQAIWMPPPHPVIPGSLWLAGAGAGSLDEAAERFYERRLGEATGHDLDRPVVVYCHERCWLSWNAAKRAIRYGYRRVYWFPDGIEGWQKAGFSTAVAQPELLPGQRESHDTVQVAHE
ncbi:MAG TPA: quinoprotein dehydrogenase-associated SoxYZ-like carrier [Steroidobacteraceae bacterium]|nr:quinoprotein dehydrogenase-associated SoxYZ-like carrier [Steroidobacteraceae bacterium]